MSRKIQKFVRLFVLVAVVALQAMPAFAQIATPPPTPAPESGPPPIAQVTLPEYVKTGETMEVEIEAIGFAPGADISLIIRLSKDDPSELVSETPVTVKASADPETAGVVRFRQTMTAPQSGPYRITVVYNGLEIGSAPFYSQPLDAFDTAGPLPSNGLVTLTENTDATPNPVGGCGFKYWGLWKFTVSKQTLLTVNVTYQNPLYQYYPCLTLLGTDDAGVADAIYMDVGGKQIRMLIPGTYWIGVEGEEDTVLLNNQSFELTDREVAILAWQESQQGTDWRVELLNDQYILHALADALKPYMGIPEGQIPTRDEILQWVSQDPTSAQRVLTAILADPSLIAQIAAAMPTPEPALQLTPPAPVVTTLNVEDPAFQAAVSSEIARQLAESQKPSPSIWARILGWLRELALIALAVLIVNGAFYLLKRR